MVILVGISVYISFIHFGHKIYLMITKLWYNLKNDNNKMVFSCFAVYLRHNHTRVVKMVQPVYDYPRRYTAKQLKTIYSLNHKQLDWFHSGCKEMTKCTLITILSSQYHVNVQNKYYVIIKQLHIKSIWLNIYILIIVYNTTDISTNIINVRWLIFAMHRLFCKSICMNYIL